jgi:hypothetical protein
MSRTSLLLPPPIVLGGVWFALLAVVFLAPSLFQRNDPGDDLIRNTVRLSLLYYAVAVCLMMRLRPKDWNASEVWGRTARAAWSLAWLAYLVHLATSMHFAHHWSHADAMQHTRDRSGIGEGIYVSHFFTLVWTLDVAWWWLLSESYARRSPWLDRLLHSFMAFIIFCGTVVYEAGFIRWAGLGRFALLGVAFVFRGKARSPLSKCAAHLSP